MSPSPVFHLLEAATAIQLIACVPNQGWAWTLHLTYSWMCFSLPHTCPMTTAYFRSGELFAWTIVVPIQYDPSPHTSSFQSATKTTLRLCRFSHILILSFQWLPWSMVVVLKRETISFFLFSFFFFKLNLIGHSGRSPSVRSRVMITMQASCPGGLNYATWLRNHVLSSHWVIPSA